MLHNYCSVCGDKLIEKEIGDEGLLPFCSTCNIPFFDEFKTCVLVVAVNSNKVALLKQQYVSDNWVLVAGYVKRGENAEETTKREVEEETGLDVKSVQYISSYYYKKRDILMLGFMVEVEGEEFGSSQEVDEIKWFAIEEANKYLREDSIGYIHFEKCKNYLRKNDR